MGSTWGQIKNIKLHIVTDIKYQNGSTRHHKTSRRRNLPQCGPKNDSYSSSTTTTTTTTGISTCLSEMVFSSVNVSHFKQRFLFSQSRTTKTDKRHHPSNCVCGGF